MRHKLSPWSADRQLSTVALRCFKRYFRVLAMMMLPHLQRLFSYDNWANKEVLISLQRIEKPPARSIQLLAHIVSAERLWLERIEVRPQTMPVWPSLTLTQCEQEMGTLSGRFRGYLSAIGEEEL